MTRQHEPRTSGRVAWAYATAQPEERDRVGPTSRTKLAVVGSALAAKSRRSVGLCTNVCYVDARTINRRRGTAPVVSASRQLIAGVDTGNVVSSADAYPLVIRASAAVPASDNGQVLLDGNDPLGLRPWAMVNRK